MRSALLHEERWTWNGNRFCQSILFRGNPVCACPGRVSMWHRVIERVFKEKAYTSELGIDWNYRYIAERHGYDITRGIYVEIDDWLLSNLCAQAGSVSV